MLGDVNHIQVEPSNFPQASDRFYSNSNITKPWDKISDPVVQPERHFCIYEEEITSAIQEKENMYVLPLVV